MIKAALVSSLLAVASSEDRPKKIAVIGAGYSGLAAALELAQLGYDVTVFDKLSQPGGRAQRHVRADGYTHDAGPSWYWMPEIFDQVLERYGEKREDHYNITLLDPAYRLVFGPGDVLDVPGTLPGFLEMASKLDPAADMAAFMADGALKYDVGVRRAIWEVPMWPLPRWMFSRGLTPSLITRSLRQHIHGFTARPRLQAVLEWPSQFLGMDADACPALYALMTYAGHALGTWLPEPHGMQAPALALHASAVKRGVTFRLGTPVASITAHPDGSRVAAVVTGDGEVLAVDGVVAAADYHHVEQRLLPPQLRRHRPSWWSKQVMTPTTVTFMLCVAAPIPTLSTTHTLWLDDEGLPFYAWSDVASGSANQTSLFVLVPSLGSGLSDPAALGDGASGLPPRAEMLSRVLGRLGVRREDVTCGADGYGPPEFAADFHAFRGNAFGHANVLSQSMWLKPAMDSLAVNLVYAGHLTHPGPGVPPALVSGILAAGLLHQQLAPAPTPASLAPAIACLVLLALATVVVRSRVVRNARALHRGGRTYFAAASAMPLAYFNRIAALYAVFRDADDTVDCTHVPAAERAANLDAFEAAVLATPESRLGYPPDLWTRFFAAMRADVTAPGGKFVCATTDDLIGYMGGSAAVLGEFMLPALGGDPSLVEQARALGFAFQLTNMLRDVQEDARLGRQYIPAATCAKHGIDDLAAADPASASYRSLMEEMFALADSWYAQADQGIARLPARVRSPIGLARRVYHRLHDAIRRRGYVLEPRVTVPFSVKMGDAAGMLSLGQLARMLPAEWLLVACGWVADWGTPACCLLGTWIATQLLQPAGPVTYAQFHCVWTLPALGVLALAVAARCGWALPARRSNVALGAAWTAMLCGVAVVYTTPWDSALIRSGVWASDSSRVVGTFLDIPYEEFAFFVLATLITGGCWAAFWPAQWSDVSTPRPSRLVTASLAAAFALGVGCIAAWERTFYLGMLLTWAVPVLALQWAVGGHVLAAHAAPLARVIGVAGGCMALADGWAIQRNVWVLNPEFSLWPWARGLHPEEVLFFFLSSAMCACGLTLAVWASRGFSPELANGALRGWVGPPAAEGAVAQEGAVPAGDKPKKKLSLLKRKLA